MDKHQLWLPAVALLAVSLAAAQDDGGFKPLAIPGWKLSLQAWTFHQRTLFETIDQCKALGIEYLETFPGQKISADIDAGWGPGLSDEAKAVVKAKLAETGVKLVGFGVTGVGGNEEQVRRTFDFAKEWGIEQVNCEEPKERLALIDKLAAEYGLKVGIHNHPQPSHYWNPETVLDAVAGLSTRVGSCADTGHWSRSGLVPLDCIKQLAGHITGLHFKDLNVQGERNAHDVPFGTGALDARAMLAELQRQGFTGVISIEYENFNEELAANVAKCVAWFHQTVAELAAK